MPDPATTDAAAPDAREGTAPGVVDDGAPVLDAADEALTGWGSWSRWFVAAIVGALAVGVVLRFVTTSPLWLDEALSVNIARLPLADIPDALRRDGHPPLYYVLLHGWIGAFGEGDVAVRAFSGLWGLALLPLLWVAGKRLGGPRVAWCTLAVAALSPYALRYATETRMYAMVMVLVLAGWLLLDDVVHRGHGRSIPRLVGLALLTGTLLWTHYWGMWLLAVVGVSLLVRLVRARRRAAVDGADEQATEDVAATVRAIGALVVGGVLFLPWLPALLYQGAHTGTPWARPVRPTEMVAYTVADLGGGGQPEAVVLGWFLVILVLVGLTARALTGTRLDVDLRTRPEGRPFAIAIVGTLGVATVVGYATGATYASRYAAVFVPFLLLLAALGLARLPRTAFAVALVAVLGLGLVGGYRNVTVDRSDAARSAAAIDERSRAGDLVVYCPDQLGPSTSRLLTADVEQVTYPTFADPALVDWVDYKERLAGASPEAFAAELLERAGDRQIFLVYSTSYITHEETCPALFNAIGAQRSPEVLTDTTEAWEPSAVVVFAPPAG